MSSEGAGWLCFLSENTDSKWVLLKLIGTGFGGFGEVDGSWCVQGCAVQLPRELGMGAEGVL